MISQLRNLAWWLVGHTTYHFEMSSRTSRSTGIFVGEVCCDGTSVIASSSMLEIDLAGCGIAVVESVIRSFLQASHELQSFAIGIEIAHMLCVSMSKSRSGKTFSVIINHHRTINNLITPVFINVCNDVIMISVAIPRAWWVVTFPSPFLC